MNNIGRTWRREQGVVDCANCGLDEHSHVWKCECGRELKWQDELLPFKCVCGTDHAMLWCPGNQSRVTAWVRECFTEAEAKDAPERSLRTAEEALELAQAVGVDAETLHRLVDYVFSRPRGEPAQEIAGTMVTLYAMANALGVDADAAFETELARIQTPEVIERCRRRQHEKREALAGPRAVALPWIGETCPSPSLLAEALAAPREPTPFEGPKKRKSWNP